MNWKVFLVICLIICLFMLFFGFSNTTSEEIIFVNSGDNIQIDSEKNTSGEEKISSFEQSEYEYDVLIEDDTITFYDKDGNSVIYVFSEERLENVLNVFYFDTVEEAKIIEEYYSSMIGNGKIKRVVAKDKIVSIVLDMTQFDEYKNCSKEEIESILLKGAKEE